MTNAVLNGYPLAGHQQRRLQAAAGALRIIHREIDDQATIDGLD